MKRDNIRRYIELRNSLQREKQELETLLSQISEALGEEPQTGPGNSPALTLENAGVAPRRGRGRRPPNGLSLRDAVLKVTSDRPMTKEEILQGVQRLGYRFSTNNPSNSLGVILYGKNPRFRNEGGKFSPLSGAVPAKGQVETQNGRKRRQLSPEARERIAAAQRARWAKTRSNK